MDFRAIDKEDFKLLDNSKYASNDYIDWFNNSSNLVVHTHFPIGVQNTLVTKFNHASASHSLLQMNITGNYCRNFVKHWHRLNSHQIPIALDYYYQVITNPDYISFGKSLMGKFIKGTIINLFIFTEKIRDMWYSSPLNDFNDPFDTYLIMAVDNDNAGRDLVNGNKGANIDVNFRAINNIMNNYLKAVKANVGTEEQWNNYMKHNITYYTKKPLTKILEPIYEKLRNRNHYTGIKVFNAISDIDIFYGIRNSKEFYNYDAINYFMTVMCILDSYFTGKHHPSRALMELVKQLTHYNKLVVFENNYDNILK